MTPVIGMERGLEFAMFSVECPRHHARVLLGPEAIVAMVSGPGGGIEVHWRCTCGETGMWLTGGRVPAA